MDAYNEVVPVSFAGGVHRKILFCQGSALQIFEVATSDVVTAVISPSARERKPLHADDISRRSYASAAGDHSSEREHVWLR